MGRSPCCDENGLKKGPWTPEEDHKLVHFIQKHGHGSWRALPKLAGLNRCGKSCRLRWTNYLRPDIKRGKFSPEEEETILKLHSIIGNKWSAIATHLPGRTDNEIKNFWNTHLKKKLIQMGIDPTTHRPRTDFFAALPQLIALASLHELRKANRMTDSNTNIDIIDNIKETEEIALIRYPQQPEGRLWDDHVARLQAEAIQAARLQCFQYLLQSASAMANNSGSVNGLGSGVSAAADSDAMSLLRSEMAVSSSFPPILPSSIPVQNASSHDQVNQLTTFFFEPPESYNDQNRECSAMAGFSQGENSSPTTPFNIMSAPQYSELQLPPLADISVANQQGDACSISSCKENETASIIWPDQLLLDDQFITEFV